MRAALEAAGDILWRRFDLSLSIGPDVQVAGRDFRDEWRLGPKATRAVRQGSCEA